MQIIPFTPRRGRYRFTTVLDDVTYAFVVHWNGRDESWFFDVFAEDGGAIVHGVKVVLGAYLARACRHPLVTDGAIVAHDLSGANLEATFADLGARVVVVYYTATDLAGALEAA